MKKIFIAKLLILVLSAGVLFFLFEEPYLVWAERKYDELSDTEECDSEWTYKALEQFNIKSQPQIPSDLLGGFLGLDPQLWRHIRSGSIDGGEGSDSIALSAGVLVADGQRIRSVEAIGLNNNMLVLLAGGLLDLEEGNLSVSANRYDPEKRSDIIFIDGCLTLGFPKFVGNKWQYPLFDSNGDVRFLSFFDKILVKYMPKKLSNRWIYTLRLKQDSPNKVVTYRGGTLPKSGYRW